MKSTVTINETKRKTGLGIKTRNNTLSYKLPTRSGGFIAVCSKFYLATLGMKGNSYVHEFLKSQNQDSLHSPREKRGRTSRNEDKERKEKHIKDHIESFHPQLSHYALEHAPLRRYLDPELTITYMWKDFNRKNAKVSYPVYQRIFRSMNIGFGRPSQDDCDVCSLHASKSHEDECSCESCTQTRQHLRDARLARQFYQKDRDESPPEGCIILAADMQKVMLLPKMSLKSQYFLSRLTVFNETFCSLHESGDFCVLWHEGVSGRCASDVTSAYLKIIDELPQYSNFSFWCDNCAAQNKNWTLVCGIWLTVQKDGGPDVVTFKYLQKGHTFMRPDAIHGAIGSKLKKQNAVQDWNDLMELIGNSSKKIKSINMDPSHIFCFKDFHQKGKTLPKISKMKVIMLKRNSRKLFYKLNHDDDHFSEVDFLPASLKNAESLFPSAITKARGINGKKKQQIVKLLVPHMPARKAAFWLNMESNDNLIDLASKRDQDEN